MSSRVWRSFAPPGWLIVCSVLLAVLPLIQMTSLRHKGLTTDEPLHYQYGYRVLNGSPQRTGAINSSTMPFSSLHAMTSENLAVFAQPSGISLDTSWSGQVKRGRYATIALSLLLALYVLKWSYELYGRNGALLSLSLYVFDPNLLAHGQLVTADLPAALMTTMALYHFWHFLKLGGRRRALFSAVTLGLSQLAKYSCVYLYPIFLVIAPIYYRFTTTTEVAKPGRKHSLTWNLRRWFIAIVFFAAVSIVTINLGFDFNGIGTPLSGYTSKDPFFKKLQAMPIVGNLPLPLPVPYIQGLDLVKFEGSQDITFTRPSSKYRLRSKSYFWWHCSDTSQGVASQRRKGFAVRRSFSWFRFCSTGSTLISSSTRRSAFVTYCPYSPWLQFFAEDF